MTSTLLDSSSQHRVLPPCLLGRPVHLLDSFAQRFCDDLKLALRDRQNARYWSAFEVSDVSFEPLTNVGDSERWIGYASEVGLIGFTLERWVVLSILNQRYGSHDDKVQAIEKVRRTATEERLALTLGKQLLETLSVRLQADAQARDATFPPHEFSALPMTLPAKGSWSLRIAFTEADSAEQGVAWLAMDEHWFAALLKNLTPNRTKTSAAPLPPLATRLQLALNGQLMSKEMPLAELLHLQIGDVIPINLDRTDVLLDNTRLFTATIAEHKGKLCLTSFEDAD